MLEKFMKIKGSIAGVDIGYDSIKIISLKKEEKENFLESSNIISIPPKTLEEKKVDKQTVAKALIEALKSAKPKKISFRLAKLGIRGRKKL